MTYTLSDRYLLTFALLSLQLVIIRGTDVAAGEAVSDVLKFELKSLQRTCLYEDIEFDGTYSFQYRIPQLKEQPLQHVIDAQVESPSGKNVYSGHGRQSDEGQFQVLFPGTYTFCFTSRQLDAAEATNQTASIVFLQFGLRLADGGSAWKERQQKLQQQQASQRELDKLDNALLAEKLNRTFANGEQVLKYQSEFRKNEVVGSKQAEYLGSQVQWWSIVESIVIVITGFGQVLAMKFFFTDRREMTVIAFDIGQHGISTLGAAEHPSLKSSYLPI